MRNACNYLASGSYNGTIKIWNAKTGELISTLTGHTRAVISISYSPDGKYLVGSSKDGFINLWDIASLSVIKNLDIINPDEIITVSYSPNGKQLAAASTDKGLQIWETAEIQAFERYLTGGINMQTALLLILIKRAADNNTKIPLSGKLLDLYKALPNYLQKVLGSHVELT
jgi:WD40 repeat protein